MPRKASIDAPGALQHVIIRGIERGKIFRSDYDRSNFVNRLSALVPETKTDCFAWAILENHVHFLFRTGLVPLSGFMRRLLTGYAGWFNRKYRRHGQLFQNRYKSILCQEDRYLKELVRYIHLNPLRAALVTTMEELDAFPWCGRGVLMNKSQQPWQNVEYVLGLFSDHEREARKRYRELVEKGISEGRRPDLVGGGLLRGSGGWMGLAGFRKAGIRVKGDERILGDSDFVTAFGKSPQTDKARALLCFWAHRKLGMRTTDIARRLGIGQPAVSRLSKRGQQIEKECRFDLIGR